MRGRARAWRIGVVVATVAATLVPAWLHPARAISVPITLARSVTSARGTTIDPAFPPTHIAFSWRGDEGTGVRFRTFKDGAPSRWRRAPESHDMEYGDHHYSAVMVVARPSAVQWRKSRPGGLWMGRVTVDYLNTLDGPRRRVEIPSTASAGTGAPDIITRHRWGADESIRRSRGCTRYYYGVQQMFVHHTVGINNDPHPRATMRSIYYFHTVRRGWCDIGYNFVISPKGQVFEGRFARYYGSGEIHDGETKDGRLVQGAHTASYNSGSVGVSLMGNYSEMPIPAAMRKALVHFLAWEARRHNLRPRAHHTYRNPSTGLTRRLPVIAGHRDAGATECPGNFAYASLPEIRKAVARLVNKDPSKTTLATSASVVRFGDHVTATGTVTNASGIPISEGKVVLARKRLPNGSWTRIASTQTDIQGAYSFDVAPRQNLALRARFTGNSKYARSSDGPRKVWVRPDITLHADGGVTGIDGLPHFSPDQAVPLAGRLRPPHPGSPVGLVVKKEVDGSYEIVEEVPLTLDADSRYAHGFEGDAGVYRARVKFAGDANHLRSWSPILDFVIGL